MVKRLQRLRKFSSAKDEPTWQQPDRLDCVEHGGCTPLEIDGITAQFCAFEWLDERNRLVDFSFEIQVRRPSDSEWCVAYRADAKHGVVHEHKFWPDGRKKRKDLRPISGPRDVEELSATLRNKVTNEFESEIRRWTP